MTQPSDPPDEQGRPRDPAPSGTPHSTTAPPPRRLPRQATSRPLNAAARPLLAATSSPEASSYQSASQPPPADRPAFGPQYAYQYGQQYGGAAPGPGWPGEAPTQAAQRRRHHGS